MERFTVFVETQQRRGASDFGLGGGGGSDLICLDFQRSCEVEETRTRRTSYFSAYSTHRIFLLNIFFTKNRIKGCAGLPIIALPSVL